MDKRRKLIEARKKKLSEKNSGGFKYFLIKDGTTRMRMPKVSEDEEFCVEVMYFFLGKDIGGVVSPATFGEPCPIDELYQSLKSSSDENDVKLSEKIKPKRRYMGPFIQYKDERGKEVNAEAGVKLALLPGSCYQDMCDFYLDDEKGDFTDPRDGYDLKFKRSGQGQFDTSYTVLDCKPTRLPKEYSKEVYSPEEMVRELIPTFEEAEVMLKKYLGESTEDEDDAPRTRKKKKSSSTGTKKKRRKRSSDI